MGHRIRFLKISPTAMKNIKVFFTLLIILYSTFSVCAQENYEIQVYGSQTVSKNTTMLELHSNFTFNGSKEPVNGVLPTNHVFHETIEITHGFTEWFEVGFYFFNSIGDHHRTTYVGSHIRPRLMLPEKYHFPVGLSLSTEFGYQKREYSEDDWSVEIRPIIDKTIGGLYVSLNPVLEIALHGLNAGQAPEFTPNVKLNYAVTKTISPGLEYYGGLGPVNHFDAPANQQHQLFFTVDLNFSADWEFNAGYGIGLTDAGDKSIFKIILGRRFKH